MAVFGTAVFGTDTYAETVVARVVLPHRMILLYAARQPI